MKTLVFVLISVALLSSCTFREVEIGNIEGVSIKSVTKEMVSLELMVPVKNNNNFAFTISDINIDLTLSNVNLGKVKKSTKIRIPANSSETQNVGIDIKFSKLTENPLSLITAAIKNKIELKATGYIKGRRFIFTKKFEVNENQPVKLFKKGLL